MDGAFGSNGPEAPKMCYFFLALRFSVFWIQYFTCQPHASDAKTLEFVTYIPSRWL